MSLAVLSGCVLCLGSQIFIDYQNFAVEHSNWLDPSSSAFMQNGALNLINAKARLFQFVLLILWCAYAGMTVWAFIRRKHIGLKTCLLLLALFATVFVAGYYALYAWLSENILILNMALLLGLLVWVWVSCANRSNMLPPSYRFRILKPWVLVAFVLVFMQAILSGATAIIHNSECHFWPYCSSLLSAPPQGPIGNLGSNLLLLLGRDFSYQFGSIICFCYLTVLSAILIFSRSFAPLRHLGGALLICVGVQFYLSTRTLTASSMFASVLWQQAFIFSALAVLVCLFYRVFTKNLLRRLYI